MSILSHVRKAFVLVTLLALALPAIGLGAQLAKRLGEGSLSVEDGVGRVVLQARGGAIGRLDRGTITIVDLTPNDANIPVVTGLVRSLPTANENAERYVGTNIRFRIVGGSFRIVVDGRGIDLSAVGRGSGSIRGETLDPGLYSLDGADCRARRAACEPLPEVTTRFQLGGPEKPERDATRSSGG